MNTQRVTDLAIIAARNVRDDLLEIRDAHRLFGYDTLAAVLDKQIEMLTRIACALTSPDTCGDLLE